MSTRAFAPRTRGDEVDRFLANTWWWVVVADMRPRENLTAHRFSFAQYAHESMNSSVNSSVHDTQPEITRLQRRQRKRRWKIFIDLVSTRNRVAPDPSSGNTPVPRIRILHARTLHREIRVWRRTRQGALLPVLTLLVRCTRHELFCDDVSPSG